MDDTKKPDCKYWNNCYQKNPAHHEKYNHPPEHLEKIQTGCSPSSTTDEENKTKLSPNSKHKSTSSGISDANKISDNSGEISITDEYNEVMKNLSGKNYLEIFQERVRYSQKKEYDDLLKTPEFIRHKFLVEMPPDFYKFWDFCVLQSEKQSERNKCPPQKIFDKFGLHLIGPFDYLSGNFSDAKIYEPAEYLRHWRFYYDPPEFQSIFMKSKSCIHYGYWRDDPKDNKNLLLARNDADKGCEFEFIAGNCFEGVLYFLDKDCSSTPFNRKQIAEMKKSIEEYTQENNIQLNTLEKLEKEREKNTVCKTFHKAGLVVPFNRKTEVGYRSLIESDANIKKILSKLEKPCNSERTVDEVIEALQPIITAANIAIDECDFGTAIELGIDLFCSGHKSLHDVIRSLLIPGYGMLKKPQFIAIIKSHLENRQEGYNLSIFD